MLESNRVTFKTIFKPYYTAKLFLTKTSLGLVLNLCIISCLASFLPGCPIYGIHICIFSCLFFFFQIDTTFGLRWEDTASYLTSNSHLCLLWLWRFLPQIINYLRYFDFYRLRASETENNTSLIFFSFPDPIRYYSVFLELSVWHRYCHQIY